MPPTRFTIRPAHFSSVFFKKRADSGVAVHRFQHFKAGAVESDQGKVIVERREPPLIFLVLVSHEVGNMPRQKSKGVSGEMLRRVDRDSRFHCRQAILERRSLPEPVVWAQGVRVCLVYWLNG